MIGLNVSGGDDVQLWNLLTQQKTGQLVEKVARASEYSLSEDGRYLAVNASGGKSNTTLQLWSFDTGKVVKEIECDGPTMFLEALVFTGADRLLTQTFGPVEKGYRRLLRVWSVAAGTMQREIEIGDISFRTGRAVSPGGRYLAGVEGSDLYVIDIETGQTAGRLLLPPLIGTNAGMLQGMSFSPDGRFLGLVYGQANSRLVILDVATGKLSEKIELAGQLPTAISYRGEAVEWLGDHGWCLFGGTLIDRRTHRVVWNLDVPIGDYSSSRRSLPSGWISRTGPYDDKRLAFIPIPWQQITGSLTALEQNSPAHLRPGGSVGLNVTIEAVRFGTPEDTKAKLTEIFSNRFTADSITVADGQPVVLNVAYNETQRKTLSERQGIVGPATGRTVQATKANVNMSLGLRDGSRACWTDSISYDPLSVAVREEFTDAAVRETIFRQVLYLLTKVSIPHFVPQDDSLVQLPGVTKIEP